MVARSVCWRSVRSLAPSFQESSLPESRSRICVGARRASRCSAARAPVAARRAGGRARTLLCSTWKSGVTARARARKNRLPPGPKWRYRVRLLAGHCRAPGSSRARRGWGRRRGARRVAGRSTTCSKLSKSSSSRLSAMCSARPFVGADDLCRLLQDEVGIAKRRERHPLDAVRIAVRRMPLRPAWQAASFRCPRAGERQQASALEQADDFDELALSAEERGRGHGQVRAVERLERRELTVPSW